MSEGLRLYPERLNPDSSEFQATIEAISRPPERELSAEDRFEVQTFEHALANGEVPFGLVAPERVRQPIATLNALEELQVDEKKYCLDYFIQDDVFYTVFPEASETPTGDRRAYARQQLAQRMVNPDTRPTLEQLSNSMLFARQQFESNLQQLFESGDYDRTTDPEYQRALVDPQVLLDRAIAARSHKSYYRDIEKQMALFGGGQNTELKASLLTMHQERINTVLSNCYQDAVTLIRQDREGHILTDEQKEQLSLALPALRQRNERVMSEEAGFVDRESFARLLDRLDKFHTGVDYAHSQARITSALQDLRARYEFRAGNIKPDATYVNERGEMPESRKVAAPEFKHMIELVLAEYGLLSASDDYDPDSFDRAPDDLWRVVIDPRESLKSLSVDGKKRCVLIPQKFNRTLDQAMPAGVLPLIDHEVTHVIQHQNGDNIGLELFSTISSARSSAWLEAGGVAWETVAQEELFGQDRRVNFTYLAALERRLEGGTVVECALEFLKEKRRTDPDHSLKKHIATSVGGALRLFNNGGELTTGTPYATNSSALEYAEQKIIVEQIPEDKRWLFYVGRANLKTISELYRLGWLRKEDMLLPEKLPSTILEPYVREHILDTPEPAG